MRRSETRHAVTDKVQWGERLFRVLAAQNGVNEGSRQVPYGRVTDFTLYSLRVVSTVERALALEELFAGAQ